MPKIDTHLTTLLFTFLFSVTVWGADPQYHTVNIQKGEGILSLLSKYELADYECNKLLFCKLNNLGMQDHLLLSQSYYLPVKIVKYDGKSIRTTLGIKDYDKAVRIQKYNEKILSKGLRLTHYTESNILWVPHHELNCSENSSELVHKSKQEDAPVQKLVSNKNTNAIVNRIFGKNYEEVIIEDKSLANQVFYLVSGHGGPDPGAMCKSCPKNMCEDEYAYDVTLRLARNLMQHGAIVHMIIEDKNDGIRDDKYLECDKDEVIYTGAKLPLRQLDRLKQRADAVNKLFYKYKKQKVKSQKLIMVHVDSRGKDKSQDVFFYHYGKSKSSKKLAYNLKEVFQEKYDYYQKGRGYKGYVDNRGLYMLRKTLPTSVYVELANIRNQSDHKRLLLKNNRQALADWLFEGLTR
jgi:N-acetylmuramoyl-L-alanine amidase